MALDSTTALRWANGILSGDATLVALLAGGKVYRDVVDADADAKTKPGLSLGIQSSTPGPRPLRVGSQTQHHTNVTLQTRATQQSGSYASVDAVISRVAALLDGRALVMGNGANVYECTQGIDQAYTTNENGLSFRNRIVFWEMKAKGGS